MGVRVVGSGGRSVSCGSGPGVGGSSWLGPSGSSWIWEGGYLGLGGGGGGGRGRLTRWVERRGRARAASVERPSDEERRSGVHARSQWWGGRVGSKAGECAAVRGLRVGIEGGKSRCDQMSVAVGLEDGMKWRGGSEGMSKALTAALALGVSLFVGCVRQGRGPHLLAGAGWPQTSGCPVRWSRCLVASAERRVLEAKAAYCRSRGLSNLVASGLALDGPRPDWLPFNAPDFIVWLRGTSDVELKETKRHNSAVLDGARGES